MAAVAYPTVLVGLGRFGQEVVERAWQSLDEDPPLLQRVVSEPARVRADLEPVLEELLRAGRATGERREPRLDLIAFVSALQVNEGELLRTCDELAALVGERYAPMFPADRPPEQRTAALHLVVVLPRLTSAPGAAALQQLMRLEHWASGRPSFPLLARIWVVSQQTTAGTLTKEEIDSACASFALALCASGLRNEDVVASRLAHPTANEGRVGFFSVASVDLPAYPLRRYATARAAVDGLDTLIERVSQPVSDPAVAMGSIAALHHESWLTSLKEGEGAKRVRALAAELSGGGKSLPVVRVGPFDSADDVRANHDALFHAATVERSLTSEDRAKLDEVLAALDRAEADAAADVQKGLDAVLAGTLAPTTGLARLPAVELGLRRASASLQDEQSHDAAQQEVVEKDLLPTPVDPLRAEVESALEQLPSRWLLIAAGAATGLAFAYAIAMGVLLLVTPAPAPGAAFAPPSLSAGAELPTTNFVDFLPWLLGVLFGAGIGYAWSWFVGRRSRETLREVLQKRRDALAALWSRGGGGPPQRQAEMQLILRRRRVRRGAIGSIEATLARLQAVRRTLGEQRDRLKQELSSMGVRLGADASQDDLSGLLAEGELHTSLVPSPLLARWVARCREVAEPAVWADRLLQGGWPTEGLGQDVPLGDSSRIDELSAKMVQPLASRSIFENDEASQAASGRLTEHARRAAVVLAPPCEPRTEHGDKVAGAVGARFVVAPMVGRQTLEPALRSPDVHLDVLWTNSRAARVLFVATWEGYTVEQVIRGAGLALGPAANARGVGA